MACLLGVSSSPCSVGEVKCGRMNKVCTDNRLEQPLCVSEYGIDSIMCYKGTCRPFKTAAGKKSKFIASYWRVCTLNYTCNFIVATGHDCCYPLAIIRWTNFNSSIHKKENDILCGSDRVICRMFSTTI